MPISNMLQFSPDIADAVGVGEAIMLQVLHEFSYSCGQSRSKDGVIAYKIRWQGLSSRLPFYESHEIKRLLTRLKQVGFIDIVNEPLDEFSEFFVIQFDVSEEQQERNANIVKKPRSSIPSDFVPSEPTLQILELQNGVPKQYSLDLVSFFIIEHANQTSSSWDSTFRTWAHKQYQKHQLEKQRRKASQNELPKVDRNASGFELHLATNPNQNQPPPVINHPFYMTEDWQPSPLIEKFAIDKDGIPEDFYQQERIRFILYHHLKRTLANATDYDTRFNRWLHNNWEMHKRGWEFIKIPHPLPKDWQPDESIYEMCELAGIPAEFVKDAVPSFKLHVGDEARIKWGTIFFDYLKKQYDQNMLIAGNNYEANRSFDRKQKIDFSNLEDYFAASSF